MIVTDKFFFLHLHKSGGSFVNRFLLNNFSSASLIGYHYPYRLIPRQYEHLPGFGLVRNPLSYYVSWYSFQKQMKRSNLLFNCVSNNGRLDFKRTISHLVNLSEDQARIDFLVENLPRDFAKRGLNLTGKCIENIRSKNIGFYSFLYWRLFDTCKQISVGKMETLREDLISFMSSFGVLLTNTDTQFIRHSNKVNCGNHDHYRNYYDADLEALIRSKDAMIFDKYTY